MKIYGAAGETGGGFFFKANLSMNWDNFLKALADGETFGDDKSTWTMCLDGKFDKWQSAEDVLAPEFIRDLANSPTIKVIKQVYDEESLTHVFCFEVPDTATHIDWGSINSTEPQDLPNAGGKEIRISFSHVCKRLNDGWKHKLQIEDDNGKTDWALVYDEYCNEETECALCGKTFKIIDHGLNPNVCTSVCFVDNMGLTIQQKYGTPIIELHNKLMDLIKKLNLPGRRRLSWSEYVKNYKRGKNHPA